MKLVFSGYLVRYPVGGHSWSPVQYLIGLGRLGHEVTYVEEYAWPNSCYDPQRGVMTSDPGYGLAFLDRLRRAHAPDLSWCYVAESGAVHGLSREDLVRRCAASDLYVNLGNVNHLPELEACRRRVLVDTDPVLTQLGVHGVRKPPLSWYQALFTFGENIGTPRSPVPTDGLTWHPTRQPVILDLWAGAGPPGQAYTTIGKWDLTDRDLEYRGETYRASKRREWTRVADLPARTGATFEMAVDVDGVPGDRELVTGHGWRVADPAAISHDPWRYRDYVRGSRGEFTVAKDMNIRLRSGWLGDRSPCYLAAGRPVVVQDTGFGDALPLGPGLHAFRDVEEAAEAIRIIEADYGRASAHATAVARECFAADRVLTNLLRIADSS